MPGILQQKHQPRPTAVEHDVEGVRLALLEILEEGFERGKVHRDTARSTDAKRRDERLAEVGQKRAFSPGFYVWAQHLFRLDAERECGITLDPHTLSMAEGAGLRALAAARAEYRGNHPPCTRCGVEQLARFQAVCWGCGATFARKGGS